MTVPFSSELQSVVNHAKELATGTRRRLSSAHLLLALFTVPNQAQVYLRERAVDEDGLLKALTKLVDEPPELLDLVLDRAARMAEGTRAFTVTSMHLLVALSGFKDCAAYRLMSQTGVDIGAIRTQAMSFLLSDDVPLRFRLKPGDATRMQPDGPRKASAPEPSESTIGFHPGLGLGGASSRSAKKPRAAPQSSANRQSDPPPESKSSEQRDLARRLFSARPGLAKPNIKTPSKPKPSLATTRRDELQRPLPLGGARTVTTAKKNASRPTLARNRATQVDAGQLFALPSDRFPNLERFGRNLTAEAARGNIDPVIGRDQEIGQLVDILNKRRANNPVLVGDPGVGKTAVVEGLARLIVSDDAPAGLEGRVLVELDSGRVFGGTGLRGSLAERIVALKEEVERAEGRIIVFLDEIHRWIGSGDQTADGVEELKPALARGTFPCIGATTHEEYRRSLEADPALGRRFQLVRIEEPSIEETTMILEGVRDDYSRHHGVELTDRALRAAARLAHRYLPDRRNPDKALAILDLAGSKARRQKSETLDEVVIAEVVSEMSGIPAGRLLMSDRERFLQMEDVLMRSIVGHERNLARIAHVLRRNYAGFVSGRPIGSFLFLGPTGVGKTETAKVLADFLFHDRDAVLALDMSELSEAHSVARLVGAPPGYVGHDSGGQLTGAIRRKAYQIVLFDEIEKASQAVQNLLLQLLEEGRLTDSQGRLADFSNTVVIMTSNLGADVAFKSQASVGFARDDGRGDAVADRVREAARGALEPELWNRIDETLVFEPLTRDQVERIAHLKLQQSSRRLLDEKGIAYTATPAVVDFLIEHGGYDKKLGARPLRRSLERYVESPIADLILQGSVEPPAEVVVDVENDELVFDVS